MRTRLCLAVALAVVALPAPAFAKSSAPACKLVKDATGDTNSVSPDASLDAQLDITSADVGTNARYLTAVVRLANLSAADPANPQGRTYEFDFTAREKNFILMASLLPGGQSYGVFISDQRFEEGQSGGRAATGIGTATGVVDTKRKEIRITAALDVFAPYARLDKNVSLMHLVAFTYRANGYSAQTGQDVPQPVEVTGELGLGVDQAWGRKAYYRSQNPTCVRVNS
jgi:hypothetical protein